jgi:flagellar basal body-associated protein FliL
MDPKKRKRRRFLILALLAVGVIAATSAYAYWTTSGTGGGTAQIANPTGINVTQTTVVNGLYPGASVPIAGTFTNSNTSDLVVTSLTATATAGAS